MIARFRDISIAVFFLCASLVAVKVFLLIDADQQQFTLTLQNADRAIIATGAAMANMEKATRSLAAKENAEYDQIQLASKHLGLIMTDADTTIVALNSAIIGLNRLESDTDSQVSDLGARGDVVLAQIPPVLASLQKELATLPALTQNVDDSVNEVKPLLASTNEVMANSAHVTENLAKVSDHYTQEILKPVNKTRAALRSVAGWFATVAGKAISPW